MGKILATKDAGNDVETHVRFVRQGPIKILPTEVKAVIQTEEDLYTLLRAGTGIKLVRSIRWCGEPGGSIIGCAPVGSSRTNLAVVRFTAAQEGILWAHEYGHNAGLNHRTNDGKAIMYPSIGDDRKVVNANESAAYLGGPEALQEGALAAQEETDDGEEVENNKEEDFDFPHNDAEELVPPDDIRDFVRQHYFHGVPYEAARSYADKDPNNSVGVLLEMLASPEENREFLPEIVTTLCYIGDGSVVRPLIQFVENLDLRAKEAFEAKNAALIHMGDLINRTANNEALAFLKGIAENQPKAKDLFAATFEAMRAADGESPVSEEEVRDELAVSATWGLALAAKEGAKNVLEELENSQQTLQAVKAMVDDALKTSDKVKEMGLQEYRSQHH